MKVRMGFVSNSSSSSYIIRIRDKSEVCPHCGRSDADIEDFFHNASYDYGDTSLQYDSKESILSDIDSQIHRTEREIKKYAALDPNEVPIRQQEYGSTTTAKELLEWAHDELKDLRDRRDVIAAVDGIVIGVSVGYHDQATQNIFRDAVKNKTIEIIEGDWA
jgi:hypothetical protein